MRSVRNIPPVHNIPVLVRTALNVPMAGARVTGDYRLRRALPTITFLSERGAKVILISHMGDKGTETLAPVAEALGTLTQNVTFFQETMGPAARSAIRDLLPGHILVLENLRRHRGETANDPAFARELSRLADIFVQDSFDTCHRAHASIVGVPTILPSYAGFLVEEEVEELSQALQPVRPSLAIIGGAKFSTKEAVLERLLASYDRVFVGGALANDFLKASGQHIGKSLISTSPSPAIRTLLADKKIVLPVDSIVIPVRAVGTTEAHANARISVHGDIRDDEVIVDHGPETLKLLRNLALPAHAILWNGPLGKYEDGFTQATDACAQAVADSRGRSVVGGGDTITSIERLGILSKFSFVSTGGGAMLDFLAHGTLPGIDALETS
jgi:phosphoglycerate kinase